MTSGTVDQAFALVRLASEHGSWDLYRLANRGARGPLLVCFGELQFRIEEDGRVFEPRSHGSPMEGPWLEVEAA